MHVPPELAIAAAVLVVGALAAAFADRIGAPALLLFLGLGALLGEDGPGGIVFNDAALVRDVGTAALAVILFEGGVLAERRALRVVVREAVALATLGVVLTAAVVAAAARLALGLSGEDALLVGAVVSSTDAAAVFAATRGLRLRARAASTLELESGLNDPVAALLVIGLIEWRTNDAGPADLVRLVALQGTLGLLAGLAAGGLAVALLRRLPLPSAGLAPVLATGVALAGYVGASLGGGSGLLAAYLAGLVVGGARVPHADVIRGFLQGIAWLAQIGLFVLLGLLLTPSRLADGGLEPLVVALALVLLARPLAAAASLLPFRVAPGEVAFVAAAGLRGGVPIVFATFPIAAGLAGATRLFDVVFFVVVASVALQGLLLRPLAGRLGVLDADPAIAVAPATGRLPPC